LATTGSDIQTSKIDAFSTGVPDDVEVLAAGTGVNSTIPRYDIGNGISAIVDTGSEISLINPKIVQEYHLMSKEVTDPFRIITANGSSSIVDRKTDLNPFGFGKIDVSIAPLRSGLDCILGLDWMKIVNAKLDIKNGTLESQGLNGKAGIVKPTNYVAMDKCKSISTISKKRLKRLWKIKEVEEVYLVEI
jgi:predicted aspartyl protease